MLCVVERMGYIRLLLPEQLFLTRIILFLPLRCPPRVHTAVQRMPLEPVL